MDRRTFLKGLFAVAVTPPSIVKVLYRPEAGISQKDLCDLITEILHQLPRGCWCEYFLEQAGIVENWHKAIFKPKGVNDVRSQSVQDSV